MSGVHQWFHAMAAKVSRAAGSVWAFMAAVLFVVAWACTGPFLGFSERWQLVVNTGTTIVTFLMVFVIQHSQNRETKAMQLKLNELLVATKKASNELVDIEEASDEKLQELLQHYEQMTKRIRHERRHSA